MEYARNGQNKSEPEKKNVSVEIVDYVAHSKGLVLEYANLSYTQRAEGWLTYKNMNVLWSARIYDDWRVFLLVEKMNETYLVSHNGDTGITSIEIYKNTGFVRVPD